MNFGDIDLDRELTFIERMYINEKYRECLKSWVADAYVYPVTFSIAFWCVLAVLEMIV